MDLGDKCELFLKLAMAPEKRREYMRKRYQRLKNWAISELGGKCIRCGSTKNLQFDHKNKKSKKLKISDINRVSDKVIRKELKKCQLLCVDCHKDKSREAWDYNVPKPRHGTYWMYRKYKCRCKKCVEAFRESHRKWRQLKK